MSRPKVIIVKRDYFGPRRHRAVLFVNPYRTGLKDKEPPERQGPHYGNKQRAKMQARNPEGLEYPKGWRPWAPRAA